MKMICTNFLNQKKLKKVFVLTGFNSYKKSGADKIINKALETKESFFYFKKNFIRKLKN